VRAGEVPGAPYFLAAVVMLVAMALAFVVTSSRRQGEGVALDPLGP
jgi:hypothetical protein